MLDQRTMIPELMDAPDLQPAAHDRALTALRRLNRVSRAAANLAPPAITMLTRRKMSHATILDVACGGGDVPITLATTLRVSHISTDLTLTDRSPTALRLAQQTATAAGIPAHTTPGTAPHQLPGTDQSFDIVTNSLFLHHLQRAEVIATLAQMARRARVGIIISDLRRGPLALAIAWIMCRLLTGSPIVHHDGPVSVRAAWTLAELRAMAAEAGLTGALIKPCWPWRMLLVWERTP